MICSIEFFEEDRVIPLAFAINKERVELSYIVPILEEFLAAANNIDIKSNPVSYYELIFHSFGMDEDCTVDGVTFNGEFTHVLVVLQLYNHDADVYHLIERMDLRPLFGKA